MHSSACIALHATCNWLLHDEASSQVQKAFEDHFWPVLSICMRSTEGQPLRHLFMRC